MDRGEAGVAIQTDHLTCRLSTDTSIRRCVIYTKRQFVGVILTVVLAQGAFGLIKLWGARHATHDGIDGTVGQAAQVIF